MVAQKVIRHGRKMRHNCYLLNSNFEKIYDVVSWDYLMEGSRLRGFNHLEFYGFSHGSNRHKSKVIGKVGKEIICRRGLRQGDSSPSTLSVGCEWAHRMIKSV